MQCLERYFSTTGAAATQGNGSFSPKPRRRAWGVKKGNKEVVLLEGWAWFLKGRKYLSEATTTTVCYGLPSSVCPSHWHPIRHKCLGCTRRIDAPKMRTQTLQHSPHPHCPQGCRRAEPSPAELGLFSTPSASSFTILNPTQVSSTPKPTMNSHNQDVCPPFPAHGAHIPTGSERRQKTIMGWFGFFLFQ